jgi:hypothetical protein
MKRSLLAIGLFLVLTPSANANLGTNLGGIAYYDGQVPFVNIVRQGGEWIGGANPKTDIDGWPTEVNQTLRMALAELHYPRGEYRVSWQGQGSFRVGGKRFSGSDGSGRVFLDGASLVLLEIFSSNSNNHLRNIRVLVPGYQPGQIFRSRYLKSLAPYRVLRFMDWQKTNSTFNDPFPPLTCKNHVRANFISQGRRAGASVVWMVKLANRININPWFTIPHKTDQTWLKCNANYIKKNLEAGLVPRFEFSNETWNPAFAQYFDLSDAGLANGLGEGDSFLAAQLETARRHNLMSNTLKNVFGQRKFLRILAGQAANNWVLEQRLTIARNATDQIAIAPYMHLPNVNLFDSSEANFWSQKSVNEILAKLETSLEEEVRPWIKSHENLGKQLIAYEGGQHLAGDPSNNNLTNLLVAANRDPGMGQLYDKYLNLWRQERGGYLFTHFTDSGPFSQYGSFGALENPDASFLAPKYQALVRFTN